MTFLRVKNWEKFQHYKGRRPPWVKFHVELLDDYDLTGLPICTQLVYDRLLLMAAAHDNRVPNDAQLIAHRLRLRTRDVSEAIKNLVNKGFLMVESVQDASTPLAEVYSRDRGRDRLETESALEDRARSLRRNKNFVAWFDRVGCHYSRDDFRRSAAKLFGLDPELADVFYDEQEVAA